MQETQKALRFFSLASGQSSTSNPKLQQRQHVPCPRRNASLTITLNQVELALYALDFVEVVAATTACR